MPTIFTRPLTSDTAANWTADNPVLPDKMEGVESDTGKRKIGNGSTAWNSLGYEGLLVATSTASSLVPPGVTLPYAGASAPSGYLLCNGAAVSRTTYAALYAVIGTAFGIGDGSSTFNVPDLRGTFPLGVSGSHALATTGGAESGTPAGTIAVPTFTGTPQTWTTGSFSVSGLGTSAVTGPNPYTPAGTVSAPAFTGNSMSILPPYIALNFVIKT